MSRVSLGRDMARGVAMFVVFFNVSAFARGAVRPDPSNAKAEVLAVQYESAFKGYRKFEDEPVASWRGANDLVHKLGGWKAFASGQVPDIPMTRPDATQGATPAPQPAPATGGVVTPATRPDR